MSVEKYEYNLKNIEERLEEKDKELKRIRDEKEEDTVSLKRHYNILAQNAANNICCKIRVDTPKIRFYKVENEKIVCLEDGIIGIVC